MVSRGSLNLLFIRHEHNFSTNVQYTGHQTCSVLYINSFQFPKVSSNPNVQYACKKEEHFKLRSVVKIMRGEKSLPGNSSYWKQLYICLDL